MIESKRSIFEIKQSKLEIKQSMFEIKQSQSKFVIKQSIPVNKQSFLTSFLDQRCLLVVDPKDNLAFCRTPKVSSSTWLSRFHSLLSGKPPGSEEISQYTLNAWHESAHQ